MVDPGGEDRVGAGAIGSDGRRASGRWSVGSMLGIGSTIGSESGMIRSVEIKRHKRVRETVIRRRRRCFGKNFLEMCFSGLSFFFFFGLVVLYFWINLVL